jgi:signal transduction histidine kinase
LWTGHRPTILLKRMATQAASPRERGLEQHQIEPGLPERRSLLRAAAVTPTGGGDATILVAAVLAAATAVWVTAPADFLTQPGWLAVQKADIILGPVLVGLYWRRRRPGNAMGTLLIAVGFLHLPYVLQSSSAPAAFSIGVLWEGVIFLTTLVLILAFPSGRLDGAVTRAILIGATVTVVAPWTAITLLSERLVPSGSLSGCAGPCPANGLQIASSPDAVAGLVDVTRLGIVVVDLVVIYLLVSRLAAAKPARRRALVIGIPIAMVFLVTQLVYQGSQLITDDRGDFHTAAQWAIAITRATLWYGFLAALIGAQLYAARVLRRIVEASLRRPSFAELEAMLRVPVGDPRLRLLFWRRQNLTWSDAHGTRFAAPEAGPGEAISVIDLDGAPAIAIVHDRELAQDPELIHAAGSVALLARENAELEAAWDDSRRVLRESRARIAAARDHERRALERDLHDSVQQHLTALVLRLSMVREMIDAGSPAYEELEQLEADLQEALVELRRLAHGIYPASLAELGLIGALTAAATRGPAKVAIHADAIGRYSPAIESAIYYSCLEALQNAAKHAGPDPRIAIRLSEAGGELHFEVSDEGVGFDVTAPSHGVGLRNIHDRLEAVDGRMEIVSAPGRGTVVSGAAPI